MPVMTPPLSGPAAGQLVTVFGASGFVGRHVVRALAQAGWRVRAACRRPDLAGHLQPMGGPGQIHAVQVNVRPEHAASIARALEGASAVVNLVGILAEGGKQRFDAVQHEGAGAIAAAAAAAGITRVVHVSAIGADAASPSAYGRSKAAGEAAVLKAVPSAVILRPSIVFGPEDDFFNRFASMAALAPALPLIGGGTTRFQPVHVDDVAAAVAAALAGRAKPGTVYELGGPEVLTFRSCLEQVLATTGLKRRLVSLPFGLAGFLASLMSFVPNAPLTPDQVQLLKRDNVVSDAAIAEGRVLSALTERAGTLAAVLPTYLWRYRQSGQFAKGHTA
jgi:NADH dehydrogenase